MSQTIRLIPASVIVLSVLSGCAGVTFYSDAGLTKKTGYPLFVTKPYLMVARTGAEDKPIEVSIVRISDPNNVVYAVPKSGFGSSKLAFTLANGDITTFGLDTDTKIPELITSVAGLLTSHATAKKTRAEAGTMQSGKDYKPISVGLKDLAGDMNKAIKENTLGGLSSTELGTVKDAAKRVETAAAALAIVSDSNMAEGAIASAKTALNNLKGVAEATNETQKNSESVKLVADWIQRLTAILKLEPMDAATSTPASEPTFELYEINHDKNGTTSLRKISP